MGIFERSRILQSVPECSIEADMSNPDQQQPVPRRVVQESGQTKEQKGDGVGMNEVVANRSNTLVDQVPQHRQIRNKQEN